MRSLFVNRIGGQIAIIILLSLAAIHAVVTASFYFSRPDHFGPPGEGAAQLLAAVRLIAATPRAERAATVARLAPAFPQLHLALLPSPPAAAAPQTPDRRIGFLVRILGAPFEVIPLSSDMIAVTLPGGGAITAAMPPEHAPPIGGGPVALSLLFILVSVTLLVAWAARVLRSPLAAFAQAAENFSLDGNEPGNIAPLPERGPEEIRAVARALNRMRDRVRTLADDRTRLFAAMSHDLRTPITRLRLRSEFIADAELRGQMLRDLDQMKAMTEGVLSFLRDGEAREAACDVDIATTLQTVADQFGDMGHPVRYDGPRHLTRHVRPNEFYRAVVNLTDNAVRHGGPATIRLTGGSHDLRIDVEDDGPGIPDARKAAMLEPFARGDDARTMGDGAGFGLGLAIARAIAEAHGGTLSLHDRAPRGLIARIALPDSALLSRPAD